MLASCVLPGGVEKGFTGAGLECSLHLLSAGHCPAPGPNAGTWAVQEELAALLGVIQEQYKVASVSHQSKGHGFPAAWGTFPVFWNKILNVTNIKDNFSKLFSNFL